jgi:hypothetical protein
MGTIHGNGSMPFPFVTLNEVPIDSWSQLVIVKDANGFQKFYRNGTLVCSDADAAAAGKVRPFRDRERGEPLRLAVPLGGSIGEAWIYPRELPPTRSAATSSPRRRPTRPRFRRRPCGAARWTPIPRPTPVPSTATDPQGHAPDLRRDAEEKVALDPRYLRGRLRHLSSDARCPSRCRPTTECPPIS